VALLQLLLTLDNDAQTDVIACWQLHALQQSLVRRQSRERNLQE